MMSLRDWSDEHWAVAALAASLLLALVAGAALVVAYNVAAVWLERPAPRRPAPEPRLEPLDTITRHASPRLTAGAALPVA